MEVVINIPEKVYIYLTRECSGLVDDGSDSIMLHLAKGVINGTALPKGHGDLIDKDKLQVCGGVIYPPAVVPADKESDHEG